MLTTVAALGILPALPLSGYWAFSRSTRTSETSELPAITSCALMTVVGTVIWSPVLLLSAAAGLYRAEYVGLTGWGVALFAMARLSWRGAVLSHGSMRLTPWGWMLAIGLLAAAGLYLGFPQESILGGRDAGVYANHGVFIARHGRLDVPYPYHQELRSLFEPAIPDSPKFYLPGLYLTRPAMTVQFGHLLSVWLAHAFSAFGHHGLFRLNGVVAMLFLPIFYGLCRTTVSEPYAVLATLFLAFNASEMWLARTTLSEIFTQLFIWSGLFLLTLALKQDGKLLARWAGVFLGFSALVRIDSLLLVPLLLIAHLIFKVADDPSSAQSTPVWIALYQTALPIFALAVCYYATLSSPYFHDLSSELKRIGIVAMIALLALLAATPRILRLSRPWLTGNVFMLLISFALVGLAAYAYLVRPRVGPYSVITHELHPLRGHRDHREDSLVNLSRYLSPVVLWIAISGWLLTFWEVARRHRNRHLIVGLVAIGGFATFYLWNPFVAPLHFYAIRRFAPIIIPGFVFLGAVGVSQALTRGPKGASTAISAIVVVFLAVFTIRAGLLIFTFSEHKGSFVQLQRLAERLPKDDLILAHGEATWVTPLFMAFDRKVIPIDLSSDRGRHALETWLSVRISEQKPVYLLHQGLRLFGLDHVTIEDMVLSSSYSEPTVDPLPKRIISDQKFITLSKITGVAGHSTYRNMPLGAEIVWGVDESGFHDQEWSGSRRVRWTNGAAKLVVPVDKQRPPKALKVDLDASGPKGTRLRVMVNGRTLLDERIPAGSWAKSFSLADVPLGERAAIELHSDSFVASEIVKESTDPRRLGVLVRAIRLLERDEPFAGKPLSNKGYHSRLKLGLARQPLSVAEGQRVPVRVTVQNASTESWPILTDLGQEKGNISLGILWFAEGKPDKRLAEQRAELPYTLFPVGEAEILVGLDPVGYDGKRLPPGEYEVWIGLVQEGVTWFYEKGDDVLKLSVRVTR